MASSHRAKSVCRNAIHVTRRSMASKPPPRAPGALRPRHLFSIADLTTAELSALVQNAATNKLAIKSGNVPPSLQGSLAGQTIAMMFAKRSTRTRVSTEAAVTALGGHPMFLGSSDIQLGVNESLRDTAVVISSMTAGIFARVGAHAEVTELAEHSSVPVINALSSDFHPLQTIADFLTIKETFAGRIAGFHGLKITWVGDSNNVLFDLAIGAMKLGANISVASPPGYGIPASMKQLILSANTTGATFTECTVPEDAVKGADILVTDTWISMGQEEETAQRQKVFSGYQITEKLAQRGGANPDWKFIHCLPRHQEEVDDAVFYGKRSLVFPGAENRLWSAVSVLEGFVVNQGSIV